MMKLSVLIWMLLLPALLLGIARGPAAPQGYKADEIQTVTLRVSPVFGALDELEDTVTTVRMDGGTISVQQVRQQGGRVMDSARYTVDPQALAALATTLARCGFYALPDYIETDVLDGHMTTIAVRGRDGQVFVSRGLVAETAGPAAFAGAYEAIGALRAGATQLPGVPLAHMLTEEGAALLGNAAQAPPLKVMVCYDTVAGGLPYTTEDPSVIDEVVYALQAMFVYEGDGWGHTDDELWYYLDWGEAGGIRVGFQDGMLMDGRMNLYPVDGLGALMAALPPALE